jgi:hypothetical protein
MAWVEESVPFWEVGSIWCLYSKDATLVKDSRKMVIELLARDVTS